MTNEQKRIAIAEAHGWFFMDRYWHFPNGAKATADGGPNEPPDYLNDRNVMIDAIKTLPPEQQMTVAELLCGDLVDVMLASAEDLAVAFLKTIGKLP